MRWPWQRRTPSVSVASATNHKSRGSSACRESRDPVLAFAQAYYATLGARTRLTGEMLQATLSDGTMHRYASALSHGDAPSTLLAPGSQALADMLTDVEARTRVSSLRLPRTSDPETLVRETLAIASKGCERCLLPDANDEDATHEGAHRSPCEGCPLLADGPRFVVNALPRRGALRIDREETATSVELTFRVAARDRSGRTDDTVRLAFDADGRRITVLTSAQVGAAVAELVAENVTATVTSAHARAEAALRPALEAAGAFLRLRSADAYHKRLDDLTATYDHLRREEPDDEDEALTALRRELAALAEVFAVDVQATLESVCFVTSPVARVSWNLGNGADLALTVDAGRGAVSATCTTCHTPTQHGVISLAGRVVCANCVSISADSPGSSPAVEKAVPHGTSAKGNASRLTTNQLAELAQLMPHMWAQCAVWLLGLAGYHVEGTASEAVWRVTRDGHPFLVEALGCAPGKIPALSEVRRIAESASREGAQGLLLTLAPLLDEVHALAHELGVTLLDRVAVHELLAGLATEHSRGGGTSLGEAKERAAAAIKTRTALLQALDNAANTLSAAPNSQRVAGAAALTSALTNLDAVRQSAAQAFLVWETLVADWRAVFPERVTPSGGLVVEADKDGLRELRDRATHLGKALASVFTEVNRTPAAGELGYDAWRTGLIEEYRAQCAALRARVAAIDPNEWEDARRARSAEAEAVAERARQEARHAAARVAKAHAQVAQLAGKR